MQQLIKDLYAGGSAQIHALRWALRHLVGNQLEQFTHQASSITLMGNLPIGLVGELHKKCRTHGTRPPVGISRYVGHMPGEQEFDPYEAGSDPKVIVGGSRGPMVYQKPPPEGGQHDFADEESPQITADTDKTRTPPKEEKKGSMILPILLLLGGLTVAATMGATTASSRR